MVSFLQSPHAIDRYFREVLCWWFQGFRKQRKGKHKAGTMEYASVSTRHRAFPNRYHISARAYRVNLWEVQHSKLTYWQHLTTFISQHSLANPRRFADRICKCQDILPTPLRSSISLSLCSMIHHIEGPASATPSRRQASAIGSIDLGASKIRRIEDDIQSRIRSLLHSRNIRNPPRTPYPSYEQQAYGSEDSALNLVISKSVAKTVSWCFVTHREKIGSTMMSNVLTRIRWLLTATI